MLDEPTRWALAQRIFVANVERDYLAPVTETHPGCEIEDAYAIAQYVTALKIGSGRRVKGHKIGLTSAPIREISGADEPDYGTLFDDMFVPEGSAVSKQAYNRGVAVEAELAFVLRDSLRGPGVTAADVLRATDFVLPALEIVDSRFLRPGPGHVVIDSVCDGAWCGGIVLGGNPRRPNQLDLREVGVRLVINDELRTEGRSSAVMGNPVNAVAWLANKLGGYGVEMRPGHVVMSGSCITIARIRAGDVVAADFDVFGRVWFSVDA
jgi:2-keto-4-pentenoate hydratase